MPMKPTIDASHARGASGRSPRMGSENTTTTIGARNVIAEASASGR